MQAAALQQAAATVGTGNDFDDERSETVRLATRRLLSTFLVLEHEEKRTLTQLCTAMAEHALVKVTAAQLNGNVMVFFDVNAFGETITAPHVRRPPVTKETLHKLFKSVFAARHQKEPGSMMPEGEIYIVLNGGRKNNGVFGKLMGAGPGCKRNRANGVKTVCRQITVTITEASVKARKHRNARGTQHLKCTQDALVWYSSATNVPTKTHKHYPELSNACNLYGPINLEPWTSLPTMTVEACKMGGGHDSKREGQAGRDQERRRMKGEGRQRMWQLSCLACLAGRTRSSSGASAVPQSAERLATTTTTKTPPTRTMRRGLRTRRTRHPPSSAPKWAAAVGPGTSS